MAKGRGRTWRRRRRTATTRRGCALGAAAGWSRPAAGLNITAARWWAARRHTIAPTCVVGLVDATQRRHCRLLPWRAASREAVHVVALLEERGDRIARVVPHPRLLVRAETCRRPASSTTRARTPLGEIIAMLGAPSCGALVHGVFPLRLALEPAQRGMQLVEGVLLGCVQIVIVHGVELFRRRLHLPFATQLGRAHVARLVCVSGACRARAGRSAGAVGPAVAIQHRNRSTEYEIGSRVATRRCHRAAWRPAGRCHFIQFQRGESYQDSWRI